MSQPRRWRGEQRKVLRLRTPLDQGVPVIIISHNMQMSLLFPIAL
jgi:hypothetical protein